MMQTGTVSEAPGRGAASGQAESLGAPVDHIARVWQEWGPAVKTGVASFVVFKLVTELFALIAVYGASFPREILRHPSLAYTFWARWDTGWYVSLATDGYARLQHVLIPPGHYQDGVAFAPALPLAIRITYRALHISPLLAGFVVVSVCLLVALVGIYQLAASDFGKSVASTTVLLVLVFPSAFFFDTVYAEAIVLMGTVWAVLLVRRDRLALAGVFATVAVLAKVAAVIILALMLIEYWDRARSGIIRRWRRLGWFLTPLLAVGAWAAYLQYRLRNPLGFLTAHQEWNHHFSPLVWGPVVNSVRDLLSLSMFDQPHGVISLLDLLSVLLLAAAAVYIFVRVRRSYGIYCGLALLAITSSGLLDSSYRHFLLAFPAFIGGAVLVQNRPWLERVMLVAMAPLLAYSLSRFVVGQWAG